MTRTATLLSAFFCLPLVAGCNPNGLFHIGPDTPEPVPFPDGRPHETPSFGQTVVQADPPPAVSGGTLAITPDQIVVAADPDRDRVFFADAASQKLLGAVVLAPHDEPGRVALDGKGHAFVALRRAGAVAVIDIASRALVEKRAVCPAPRGLAYDAAADAIHVACAGGELVTLPAAGGAPARTLKLGRDLRDVIVGKDGLYVSRFRSADVLFVNGKGQVVSERRPLEFQNDRVRPGATFTPSVAWRMFALPSGGVGVVHQRGTEGGGAPVETETPGGYGGSGFDPCSSGIVHAALSTFGQSGPSATGPAMNDLVLPVDAAVSPRGEIAVVAAGNSHLFSASRLAVMTVAQVDSNQDCKFPGEGNPFPGQPSGQPTAVAWLDEETIVVQSRQPATLEIFRKFDSTAQIELSAVDREDTGHAVFHSNSGVGVACASCHPEGGDDGRTWVFNPIGPRRTQSLRGGILQTAPFHWDGDLGSMNALVSEVMVKRMSGPSLDGGQVNALGGWLDKMPIIATSAPADPASVERGRAIFNDANGANCASCHSGARFTNNAAYDVGTGGRFQVPTLTDIAFRAPYIHDGCAETLTDRFKPCGGGDRHGRVSQLAPTQIADLVAYLETL